MDHYYALLVGYGTALVGWMIAARLLPRVWPKRDPVQFDRPWVELGLVAAALVGVVAIGQLYTRGWLLPSGAGNAGVFLDACNQLIIFSPVLVLAAARSRSLDEVWLPLRRLWLRLLIGLGLGALAMLAFLVARAGSDGWLSVVPRVYDAANGSFLVQVFLEDLAIAILFVRFRAAIGLYASIGLVATLFAAGHVPAMLADGATLGELTSLILDAGLGILAISVVQRSADIWWFWCVHFAMDMMQYYAVTATA